MGKIFGLIYAALGLIFGLFFTFGSLISIGLLGEATSGAAGFLFGIGAVVFLPIFYGAMGFVFGAITAILYNLISSFAGGLKFEMDED